MSRVVRIITRASDELIDAVQWYESRRPGLGAELYDAVDATIEDIKRQPEIGRTAHDDPQIKRVLVTRFPYQVVYKLHQDEIVILAFAHLKRRPGFWKHRS